MFGRKKIYQANRLEIKPSRLHGLGVFARVAFRSGSLIEEAPAVFLTAAEKDQLKYSLLFQYYFLVDNRHYPAAFGFGYSSFYNHSNDANAVFSFSRKNKTIRFHACREINAGQELTINYNGKPADPNPVYFPDTPHD